PQHQPEPMRRRAGMICHGPHRPAAARAWHSDPKLCNRQPQAAVPEMLAHPEKQIRSLSVSDDRGRWRGLGLQEWLWLPGLSERERGGDTAYTSRAPGAAGKA